MIDLYTWTTPNGRKIPIMLEETRLEYEVHAVDLSKDEQRRPEFLTINPNGKIPAIVDRDGPGGKPVSVFESGAILIYLAEKTGQFLPREGAARAATLEWLMYQMSAVGPIFGQSYYFAVLMKEKMPAAIQHFTDEVRRIMGVLDARLAKVEHLAGEYSIADMASYPWIVGALQAFGKELGELPHVRRWAETVGTRPAVQRGMKVPG
jgi:GSH-dependent disulfide-bond oxidoreductase